MTPHLPNLLSGFRIPAALLLLAIYRPDDSARAWISVGLVLLSMFTDFLDGVLARRYGLASPVGYLLDGLGDRAIHIAAYLLLFDAEVASAYLVWALIFREVSQYGVRAIEPSWHNSQSRSDRNVTRAYTIAVHVALLGELLRTAIEPGSPSSNYLATVNVALWIVAIASYSKIIPRLIRASRQTRDG